VGQQAMSGIGCTPVIPRNMADNEIENRIAEACQRFEIHDHLLIKNDVNERTMAARLAMYLQELFPFFDVDCEYNRELREPKRTGAGLVLPDIVIHKRSTHSHNLAILELTKRSNPGFSRSHSDDNSRLKEFASRWKYQTAFSLVVHSSCDQEHLELFQVHPKAAER
jgi:hypothetical protein